MVRFEGATRLEAVAKPVLLHAGVASDEDKKRVAGEQRRPWKR
jgi:hypothetical protein